MKDEVLYEFEVVENIGEWADKCFGEVGKCWEMTERGFIDKLGHYWDKYKTVEKLNERLQGSVCQTKFKLVETYKIDLCKIIGVDELQEFILKGRACRFKKNKLQVNFNRGWISSNLSFNNIIFMINNNEIEILPKFERLEVNEHIEWMFEQFVKDGFEYVASTNKNVKFCCSKKPSFVDGSVDLRYCRYRELTESFSKQIPLTFEMGAYSLVKHFESEV